MLRSLTSRRLVQSSNVARRQLTSTTRRLNEVPTTTGPKAKIVISPATGQTTVKIPPTPPKNKKKFSFTKLLFNTALLGGLAYGGTMFAATKNDKVMDFVIDQQLPYYEEIIDIFENGSVDDLQAYFTSLKEKVTKLELKLPSKEQFEQLTTRSEKMYEDAKNKLTKQESTPINVSDIGKDATPAQQLQKPVEAIQKPIEHLPLISLNKEKVDDSVKQTIDSFNDLIKSIDVGSNTVGKEALIRNITENVGKLAQKLGSLTTNFKEELKSKVKDSQTDLLSSYTKKELELTESLLHQFNREKSQLESKFNERVTYEIEATKKTISQAAVNAVTMMRVEQTRQFEQLIQDKLNQEREGRLAGLEALNERVGELEKFSESLENQLVANHNKTLLLRSLANLKHALSSSDEEAIPKALKGYFEQIEKVSGDLNDELVNLVLKDLKPLITNESTHSILTNAQLLNKWDELTPELRSASLLPPNAGLLGHFASMVFSKLLLPVKGSRPNGKDIESVIGRIENSLAKGELDVAVEEAANLKGWPRKLADDWIKESRKRLEIQFLVSVLESESRIV